MQQEHPKIEGLNGMTEELVDCVCQQLEVRVQTDDECKSFLSSVDNILEVLNRTNCSHGDLYGSPSSRGQLQYPENVAMSVLFGVVMVFGLISNILVIYVVVKHGITRSISNLYFISLAVADFIYLLFCISLTIAMFVLPSWPFGQVTCKLVTYLYIVAMGTSAFTLAAMAVDRYHTIVKHVPSRISRTVRKTTMRLLVIWLVNLVVCSPALLIHQVRGEDKKICTDFYPKPWMGQAYILFMFLVYYLVPLGLIGVCYLLMTRHLGRHVQIREPAKSRNKKVSKILLLVVTTFALCWLPMHVVYIMRDLAGVDTFSNYVMLPIIANFLTYLSCCLNPLIYSFMSDSFRQSFRQTLGWFSVRPWGSRHPVPEAQLEPQRRGGIELTRCSTPEPV